MQWTGSLEPSLPLSTSEGLNNIKSILALDFHDSKQSNTDLRVKSILALVLVSIYSGFSDAPNKL